MTNDDGAHSKRKIDAALPPSFTEIEEVKTFQFFQSYIASDGILFEQPTEHNWPDPHWKANHSIVGDHLRSSICIEFTFVNIIIKFY